ncbi:MAG: JAB domain-containing protein [Burkholderiales bacterium]
MTSILQPHLTPPRSREKLLSRGVQSLEDVELIALLIGTDQPSQADQLLTTQLRRTLAGLEIALLDHLIVAGSRTISAGEV